MARADLEIRLKKPDTTFYPGETLEGEVVLKRNDPADKKGKLKLQRLWRTHGKGNRASGGESEVLLSSFTPGSQPGEEVYPFSMKVPNGPFTYHGTLLNVAWMLKARLDVSWAIDPKAEMSFGVQPGPEPPPAPSDLKEKAHLSNTGSGGSKVLGFIGAVFALMGGIFVLAMMSDDQAPVFALIVPSIFVLVGLGLIFLAFRNSLASRKLGEVRFTVAPLETGPGQEVACHLHFIAKAEVKIRSIQATLLGQEVVVRGSGTDRTTYTEEIHKEIHSLMGQARTLRAGMPFDEDVVFQLPERAPLSFSASDNALKWLVKVEVDIENWPDWTNEQQFIVWPQRAHSSAPVT